MRRPARDAQYPWQQAARIGGAMLASLVLLLNVAPPGAGVAFAASLMLRVTDEAAPGSPTVPDTSPSTTPPPDVELFSRRDCPQCAKARAYLAELQAERPALRVSILDVVDDPAALARLREHAERAGVVSIAVPAFAVREHLVVGWADRASTGARIEALLDGAADPLTPLAGDSCAVETDELGCVFPTSPVRESVTLPLVGSVGVSRIGLPLFTAIVGLLDGFNPCAMWVLLLLLALLVNLRSRARMLLVAGTFILASGLVYFAFMAAWLNVFLLVGFSRDIQVLLGVVALVVALVNLKDVVAFKVGVSLSIPDAVKPRLYARIGEIPRARGLPAAIAGVAVLAILVNSVELLCTAGLPAVYTQVLTSHALETWQYYAYIGLYQVFYMLDDAIMLAIAVVTLSRRRLQEREGRWLKLVSGIVLAGLGIALLIRPELLHWT